MMKPPPYYARQGLDNQPLLEPGFAPPPGWDAADAVAQGWTPAHIALLSSDLREAIAPPDMAPQPWPPEEVRAGEFLVNREGTFFCQTDAEGHERRSLIASPIWVAALTRDADNRNWGLTLRFQDRDRYWHTWTMPRDYLIGSAPDLVSRLLNMGADVLSAPSNRSLSAYLMAANPEARKRCVVTPGWHGPDYVGHSWSVGPGADNIVFQTIDPTRQDRYKAAATLVDWQREVGQRCRGNSRLILAISASFAAIFLHPCGQENFGIHFRGPSSTGKTRALRVAASVWGTADLVGNWRATANGMEGKLAQHNDGALLLDELGQVSPKECGDIAYTIGNGVGKQRANPRGEARDVKRWRTLYLSTGEVSLADHMRSAGLMSRAGQELRLLEIPADAGRSMGMFEDIHGEPNSEAFAQRLWAATEEAHGTAIPALLGKVTADPATMPSIVASIKAEQRRFVEACVPRGSHGQISRAAGHFGFVAAVGEFCIQSGILPWVPGEAGQGVRACFDAWLEGWGGTTASEEERLLSQVRRFIELHGSSRFSDRCEFSMLASTRVFNRAGFTREEDGGGSGLTYYILPEVFSTEVCAGFNAKWCAEVLKRRGHLIPGSDRKNAMLMRLPGLGPTRVYALRPSIVHLDPNSELVPEEDEEDVEPPSVPAPLSTLTLPISGVIDIASPQYNY